ncbi:MAG: pitrilysin family protein [bacterium]
MLKKNPAQPYSIVTLPTGLRVLTVPLHDTKAVTVLVLTKVGSRYESKRINGISHFVEHLMFKGTKKRPNSLAISKLLDGVGAEYNAFTSKDHTGYYVKINSEHLDLALDVVSDMLNNSKFDPKEIDRERGVIIEEINMYEDNPLMYLEDIFEQTLYSGSTLGRLIAGPRINIKNISRQNILDFVKTHYIPSNMLVAVSGRFDETKIKKQIKSYFSQTSAKRTPSRFKKFSYQGSKPKIGLEYKDTEQAQIGLGFPAVSYFSNQLSAFVILSTILGGNMSSRLFIQIRERRGLAYAIRCTPTVYQDTGNLFIQAGVARARAEESISAILFELEKVADKGVTSVELARAKEFIKGKLILELEDSESIGAWFAKQWLLTNKIETPNDKLIKIQAVTKEQVNLLAKKLFKRSRLNLAVIGPFKSTKQFGKLINKKS